MGQLIVPLTVFIIGYVLASLYIFLWAKRLGEWGKTVWGVPPFVVLMMGPLDWFPGLKKLKSPSLLMYLHYWIGMLIFAGSFAFAAWVAVSQLNAAL